MKKYPRITLALGLGAAAAFVGAPVWMSDFDVLDAIGDPPVASFQTATDTGDHPVQWNAMLDYPHDVRQAKALYVGKIHDT